MNANTAERVMQYRKGVLGVSGQDRERSKESRNWEGEALVLFPCSPSTQREKWIRYVKLARYCWKRCAKERGNEMTAESSQSTLSTR